MSDELFEFYSPVNDNFDSIYLDLWSGQTFTPQISHTITSAKLNLQKVGVPTGTMYVYIEQTVLSKPSGTVLCTGTYDAPLISSVASADYEFLFGSGSTLTASTMYAITAKLDDAGGTDSTKIKWNAIGGGAGTYTGGDWQDTSNAGATWTTITNEDHDFKEYGIATTQNLNLNCETGVFTLTGISILLQKPLLLINLICETGSYILSGITTLLERTGIQWNNQAKSSDISPINSTKNSISPTNSTKNSISPTNSTKNSISPTNSAKNSSTFTNSTKS